MFSGENEIAWQRVRDNVRIPLYGCDCYAYGLLAAGQVDLVVEADLKPYDYMALVPVIQVSCRGLSMGDRGAGKVLAKCKGNQVLMETLQTVAELLCKG